MLQYSIGDIGDLNVQASSWFIAEGKGLVRLRIAQQADLGVACRLDSEKGELFTCVCGGGGEMKKVDTISH